MYQDRDDNWEHVPDPEFDRRQNVDYLTGDTLQLFEAESAESFDMRCFTELDSDVDVIPYSSKRARHLQDKTDESVYRITESSLPSQQTGSPYDSFGNKGTILTS